MRMTIPDGTEVMQLLSIERSENNLVLKVTVMGALPTTVLLTPDQARKGLRLLNWRMLPFLLSFLFRK